MGEDIITAKNLDKLTLLDDAIVEEYMDYMRTKIVTIGTVKHDISILKFFKYKKKNDIGELHRLANSG